MNGVFFCALPEGNKNRELLTVSTLSEICKNMEKECQGECIVPIVYLAFACLMIAILLDIFLLFLLLQMRRQAKQAKIISADSTTKEEV